MCDNDYTIDDRLYGAWLAAKAAGADEDTLDRIEAMRNAGGGKFIETCDMMFNAMKAAIAGSN